jgi:hypothetical protein
MILLFLLMLLNFAISWYNAYAVGKSWVESKAVGGWIHMVTWSGAIMSAIGFSSVYIFIMALIAAATGYLPGNAIEAMVGLWYLIIIIPLLTTGLLITIESWRVALRERSLLNMGVAGWNTFSQAYNTYSAITSVGDVFGKVSSFFSSDDEDVSSSLMAKVLLLVVIGLLGGALTTAMLVQRYAGTVPLPARDGLAYGR